MKPHPQASILRAIADGHGAQHGSLDPNTQAHWVAHWVDMSWSITPLSHPYARWRIKPKMHLVNGIECPAPETVMPPNYTRFYCNDYKT
jgi:hypothetical protein